MRSAMMTWLPAATVAWNPEVKVYVPFETTPDTGSPTVDDKTRQSFRAELPLLTMVPLRMVYPPLPAFATLTRVKASKAGTAAARRSRKWMERIRFSPDDFCRPVLWRGRQTGVESIQSANLRTSSQHKACQRGPGTSVAFQGRAATTGRTCFKSLRKKTFHEECGYMGRNARDLTLPMIPLKSRIRSMSKCDRRLIVKWPRSFEAEIHG
jgi:hypothetical protein